MLQQFHFAVKYKLSARDYYLLVRGIGSQVTLAAQSVPIVHSSDRELWLLRGQTLFCPVGCAMQVESSSKGGI